MVLMRKRMMGRFCRPPKRKYPAKLQERTWKPPTGATTRYHPRGIN